MRKRIHALQRQKTEPKKKGGEADNDDFSLAYDIFEKLKFERILKMREKKPELMSLIPPSLLLLMSVIISSLLFIVYSNHHH